MAETLIPELAVVELLSDSTDSFGSGETPAGTVFPKGTKGTVVDARPDIDRYTVEIVEEGTGATLALLDCRGEELKVTWTPTVAVNGHEMSYGLMHSLVKRTLWKQTAGANLDTDEGCEDAANAIAGLLTRLGRHGYLPTDQD